MRPPAVSRYWTVEVIDALQPLILTASHIVRLATIFLSSLLAQILNIADSWLPLIIRSSAVLDNTPVAAYLITFFLVWNIGCGRIGGFY